MNPTKVGFRYMQRNKVVWVIVFYHMVLTKKEKKNI
jgi:ribosomal protein L16/L10AE